MKRTLTRDSEVFNDFLQNLESGVVTLDVFEKKEESEEYWKKIHFGQNITELNFKDSGFLNDFEENIPKMIENNPNLRILDFKFSDKLVDFNTKFFKQSLKDTPALQYLNLAYYSKSHGRKLELKQKNDLKSLFESFEDSLVSDVTLNELIINNTNVKSLSKMKNLKTITFIDCDFTEDIYEYPILVKDVDLILRHTKCLPKNEIPYNFLKMMKSMICLNLSSIKPLNFKKFADSMKDLNLKKLSLFDFVQFENPEYLNDVLNQKLEYLNIPKLKNKEMMEIPYFSYLKENNSLKELKVDNIKNFQDIDIFLLNNKNLKKLNLGDVYNQMSIISKGITKNHSLESLSFNNLSNDDFQYFNQGIMRLYHLETLNLPGCNINDDLCSFFTDYLLSNKVLKYLTLSSNIIKDEGVRHICNGLKETKTLYHLDLWENGIEVDGCKSLGNLLKFNTSIQELDLSKNPLGNKGMNYISEGLMYNNSLLSLFCFSDSIDLEKMDEFLNNLFYNLTLNYCPIGLEENERFDYIMLRNSNFISIFNIKFQDFYHNINFKFE